MTKLETIMKEVDADGNGTIDKEEVMRTHETACSIIQLTRPY